LVIGQSDRLNLIVVLILSGPSAGLTSHYHLRMNESWVMPEPSHLYLASY
jgi:hypothetical protein